MNTTNKPKDPGIEATTGTAVVLTNDQLDCGDAKTAHGLIRGSERFDILAVIDSKSAGRDAGEVLDGIPRSIPVFASLDDFMTATGTKPDYALVGVALSGGIFNQQWQDLLLMILKQGISIVNGLHMLLGDIPEFMETARANKATIIDIRRPKSYDRLHHWSGRIFDMKIPRLSVLGSDCAIGKRTTCRMILEACQKVGITTEMIYTGQTGWFQGYRHGFILDATLNDFVCGELEAAVIECEEVSSPDLMLIEGQSALRNPIGPCGAEIILSANVKGIILQHAPFREMFDCTEEYGCLLPSLENEISLVERYGTRVLAVTLNGEGGSAEDLAAYAETMRKKIDIPIIRPLEEGVSDLLPVIRDFIDNHEKLFSTTPRKPF